ncbi:UvrD-helicase domain-containing protein [Allokutzneria sp. NRRL B-24872]|uniref:UvrD-helicase domain-containing protein n=1 Tax=Allokutzneria sp. NRRL B-24872 TaxID=1137961 RepID=UPI000A3C8B97|nr:UvrD-helicase domain-containing protein [Allokutzneria sp. NRRL B-24872]
MRFYADLHIHSKYSRACSRNCDLHHLTKYARLKGISLVGTGDFTHPAWFEHLQECLVPAEPGLFRMREDIDRDIRRMVPPSCADGEVRYMLSVEISTIYKRGERTRKVHHLIYMPDFESAAEFNARLGRIGNLGSDGRPILGLDSRDLLEITLSSGSGGYLVPAHIWTPWFAALGSKSGFDAISDCYVDLADHIFAVETGLSSDPAMNWQVSGLDKYRLVSNSDAHSPPMLGREATVFDTGMDYFAIRRALETGDGFGGTVEFFPEEGKYHLDGHRKCDVRMEPEQTRAHGAICPECRKPLTVGVLNRISELADRPYGTRPEGAASFRNLIPLPEIMGEILGVGPKSKKVQAEVAALTAAHGPELSILDDVPLDDLSASSTLVGEAIARLRRGEVIRDSGYDGEYGVIKLFEPGELDRVKSKANLSLFDLDVTPSPTPAPKVYAAPVETAVAVEEPGIEPAPQLSRARAAESALLDGLDPDQRAAAELTDGPSLIIAGPGTGKTRTLTHKIAHLVTACGVPAERCLAITFTRRAAEEMAERLGSLVPEHAAKLTIATFHSLGVRILRENHALVGLTSRFGIADEAAQLAVLAELLEDEKAAKRALSELPADAELADRYTKALRAKDLVDFDDLIALPVRLLESAPEVASHYRERFQWISVDEYQDVDETQYRLLRLLAPENGNLTAIGDPDQAIYRFRGADVGFFLRFQQDYPGARTVQLTRNYRSGPHILAGALQAITPTSLVPGRELTPAGHHPEPALIGLHHASDEHGEAAFVARTIDQLLGGSSFHSLDSGRVTSDGSQGLGFADFAVLYRTDAQAKAVMEALTRAGVPFQKRSHDRLADRPGVREIVRDLNFEGTSGSVIERIHQAATPETHAAIDLLAPLARRCGDDIERFRTEIALGAEVDTWDPKADLVTLLTLHAAKGLEFPVVFMVGCEDGLLPMRWPGAEPDQEEENEERRLFFVGMTRAQRHLYLSHAAQRVRQGSSRPMPPSPFLDSLDSDVVERLGSAQPPRRKPTQLRLL